MTQQDDVQPDEKNVTAEPQDANGDADAATAEPEAAEALEPAPAPVKKCRQWVTLRGTSMDARVGRGIVDDIAHDLKSVVGRPHACALLHAPDVSDDVLRTLSRGLSDQGFEVLLAELPSGDACCDLAHADVVAAELARMRVTSDDLVVAVGHLPELSLATMVCHAWCGGTSLALVPCDLVSAVLAGVTPQGLAVGGTPDMLQQDGSARFEICDLDLMGLSEDDPASRENVLLARALMAATAMADSSKAFETLFDATDGLVAGDLNALTEQLTATLRSRGKVVASTSVAVRQSIAYGQSFVAALSGLVGADVPRSAMLADALRFCARLAVASGELSLDDMFTQDELLERLELGSVDCLVDADALYEALRAERFLRTNRFMVEVPRALGRVRLTNVEEATLREHVGAWCAARSRAE